jgi:hypothetical protein
MSLWTMRCLGLSDSTFKIIFSFLMLCRLDFCISLLGRHLYIIYLDFLADIGFFFLLSEYNSVANSEGIEI